MLFTVMSNNISKKKIYVVELKIDNNLLGLEVILIARICLIEIFPYSYDIAQNREYD